MSRRNLVSWRGSHWLLRSETCWITGETQKLRSYIGYLIASHSCLNTACDILQLEPSNSLSTLIVTKEESRIPRDKIQNEISKEASKVLQYYSMEESERPFCDNLMSFIEQNEIDLVIMDFPQNITAERNEQMRKVFRDLCHLKSNPAVVVTESNPDWKDHEVRVTGTTLSSEFIVK